MHLVVLFSVACCSVTRCGDGRKFCQPHPSPEFPLLCGFSGSWLLRGKGRPSLVTVPVPTMERYVGSQRELLLASTVSKGRGDFGSHVLIQDLGLRGGILGPIFYCSIIVGGVKYFNILRLARSSLACAVSCAHVRSELLPECGLSAGTE